MKASEPEIHQGKWWLPNEPFNQVYGDLKFTSHDGAKLSLINPLPELPEDPKQSLIVGLTSNGQRVTLYEALRIEEALLGFAGVKRTIYHAPVLLVGASFDRPEEIRFSEWSVHFPALSQFVGRHGLQVHYGQIGPGRPKLEVLYETPEKHPLATCHNGMSLAIRFGPTFSTTSLDEVSLNIEERTYLDIVSAKEAHLSEFMASLELFQHFLSLATGTLVWPESVAGLVQLTSEKDPLERALVDIRFQPISEPRVGKGPLPNEMLFRLEDIKGWEDVCLGNWFNKEGRLGPVYDLYFGTLYNPSTYQDLNFLTLIQALESYHRLTSRETDAPSDLHAQRMSTILAGAPVKHRRWLRERLTYSNELRLRQRLTRLFEEFRHLVEGFAPRPRDRKALIDSILTTRNYFTHYDERLKDRAASGTKLLCLIEVLKLILQASFLKELGFLPDMLDKCLSRSRTVRLIRHLQKYCLPWSVHGLLVR